MFNISDALSSNTGLQNIEVFYDSLFFNLKVFDPDVVEDKNLLLIQKVNFDFDQNTFLPIGKYHLIDFGDTFSESPQVTKTGNILLKNIFLEKEKEVLICGLSSTCPLIYNYNLNDNSIKKIFPVDDLDWSNLELGTIDQNSRVSYNKETKKIHYVISTTKDNNHILNFVEIKKGTELELISVNSLSSSNVFPSIVDFNVYNQDEKLLICEDNGTLVSFKI